MELGFHQLTDAEARAIEQEFPGAQHVYCAWHVARNLGAMMRRSQPGDTDGSADKRAKAASTWFWECSTSGQSPEAREHIIAGLAPLFDVLVRDDLRDSILPQYSLANIARLLTGANTHAFFVCPDWLMQ